MKITANGNRMSDALDGSVGSPVVTLSRSLATASRLSSMEQAEEFNGAVTGFPAKGA